MATAQSIDRPFDARLLYARVESARQLFLGIRRLGSIYAEHYLMHGECRLTRKVRKNRNAFPKNEKNINTSRNYDFSRQFVRRSSYFYLFRRPEISIN